MDEEDNPILKHYASQYYDPAKAREYYLKTRELKGRQSGEKLSAESRQRQSEASSYVRNQISTERSAVTKSNAETQQATLEKLRDDAKATRDRIVANLKAKIEQLKSDAEASIPKPNLNKIVDSMPEKQKEFLREQNRKMTAKYNSDLSKAQKEASKAGVEARDAARAEVLKVGTDLKAVVEKARTDYTAARTALAEKYKSTLKTELENIQNQVR